MPDAFTLTFVKAPARLVKHGQLSLAGLHMTLAVRLCLGLYLCIAPLPAWAGGPISVDAIATVEPDIALAQQFFAWPGTLDVHREANGVPGWKVTRGRCSSWLHWVNMGDRRINRILRPPARCAGCNNTICAHRGRAVDAA